MVCIGSVFWVATAALRGALPVLGLFAAFASVPIWQGTQVVQAQSRECFTETGFCISNPRFQEYFHLRGGISTFGYPISREFRLQGFNVQFFQGLILQQPLEGGSVRIMNLLGPDMMPASRINGSTFPAADPAIVDATPRVGEPDYASRIVAFTRAQVPNEFGGRHVGFLDKFISAVTLADAFPMGDGDTNLLPLLNLEIWGAPTSAPQTEPTNGDYVYQRFQRGILHYRADCDRAERVLLADWFKSVITGQLLETAPPVARSATPESGLAAALVSSRPLAATVPPDLAAEMANSPFYLQYRPGAPRGMARPEQLPDTDLTGAFDPELPGFVGPGAAPELGGGTGVSAGPGAPRVIGGGGAGGVTGGGAGGRGVGPTGGGTGPTGGGTAPAGGGTGPTGGSTAPTGGGGSASPTGTPTPTPSSTDPATPTPAVTGMPTATATPTASLLNGPPTITHILDQMIVEDGATGALAFTVSDAETAVGSLTLSASSSDTTLVPNANIVYGGTDGNRTLTITPAPDENGTVTITVTVSDGSLTASDTFVLTVAPVNDAPSFTRGADQTVAEDAGAQTVTAWATAISAGPPNESAQTLTFVITNITNTGLFAAAPVVSPTGVLTYTPALNASGSATITLKLTDDGGGTNESAPQTLDIVVTAVNDAPTLDAIADPAAIQEDAGAQTVNLTGIGVGAADEAGQTLTVTATSSDTGLIPHPTVTYTSPGATGSLSYTPVANANGSATITVRVQDSGGTANGGVDVFARTFAVVVTAVNDPPSFTKGADQTNVDSDGVPRTVASWATGFSPGPANESGQAALEYVVTVTSHADVFTAAPAVDAAGALTFTPSSGVAVSTTATVDVRARDDGGTANGGVDTSPPQSFAITVVPFNTLPTISDVADQAIDEDGTTGGLAFTVGDRETAAGNLTVAGSSSNTTLVPTANIVFGGAGGANRTVTVAPAANQFGTATITVTVTDGGGAQASDTFVLVVAPINDAPTARAQSYGAQTNMLITIGGASGLLVGASDAADVAGNPQLQPDLYRRHSRRRRAR